MPKPFSPTVLSLTILSLTDCGEPMQFENAGSKHVLAEDQQACDREMHTPGWAQYVKDAKGRVDPWQVCVERKGWRRVDRPLPPLPPSSRRFGGCSVRPSRSKPRTRGSG